MTITVPEMLAIFCLGIFAIWTIGLMLLIGRAQNRALKYLDKKDK